MKKETQQLIDKVNKEYHERKFERIRQAREWGKELNGELVGICGHLTGAGAREYPVFRQEDGRHFISLGDREQLYIFEGNIDEYMKVQDEIRQKRIAGGKRIIIKDPPEDFEERNKRVIRFINPEEVFGRKMQTLEEWLK